MEEKFKYIQGEVLPTVAIRGFVVFPKAVLHFDIGREKSVEAISYAMESGQKVFLITQIDPDVEDPDFDDLYKFGVVAEIQQVIKNSAGDTLKIVVEGKYRAKLVELVSNEMFLECLVDEVPVEAFKDQSKADASVRSVKYLFEKYSKVTPKMPKDISDAVELIDDPEELSDFIGANIIFHAEEKQDLLESTNLTKRYEKIIKMLENEIHILSLERNILDKVKDNMDAMQRDRLLREQLRAISEELGEGEGTVDELDEYRNSIIELKAGIEVTEKLLKEVDKLARLQYGSPESSVIRGYIDTCLEIPFSIETKDKIDLRKIQKILDRDHYGMEKVKNRISELMAVQSINEKGTGQILCLVGPPGIGKTSIGKSIAEAVGRNYVRISLGGIRDEADIRGHRKTYVGSMPGRIIDALIKAKSRNPLILFDEIDKMNSDYKGDPASAMLEVLDSEQNKEFRDHFIELPIDLSDVLFICTANDISMIPAPLRDRMDIVEMSSYTRDEKFNIAKKFLIPKQMKKLGVKNKSFTHNIKLTDKALFTIIDNYTRESGVRTLERIIATCISKAVKEVLLDDIGGISINEIKLVEYLGPKLYLTEKGNSDMLVGTVNGLAWTSVGGEMLPIEVSVLPGTGKIDLTGNLGNIMKESAHLAISYVRSVSEKYDVPSDFYKNKDIHIHAPEGAVPKDGPSAGIALSTALLSSLTGMKIDQGIAMTGEISLLGKVFPIGGLREKSMAAHRAGITRVLIPYDNLPNLDEIDDTVKNSLKFIPVKSIEDVFDFMFGDQIKKHKNSKGKTDQKIMRDDKVDFVISRQ